MRFQPSLNGVGATAVIITLVLVAGLFMRSQERPATKLLGISDSLSGKEKRSFLVELPASGFIRIALKQKGLDCQIRIKGDGDFSYGLYESRTGRFGEEFVALRVRGQQVINVTVESRARPELHGNFELSVEFTTRVTSAELMFTEASRIDLLAKPRSETERRKRIETFVAAGRKFSNNGKTHQAGVAYLAAAALAESSDYEHAQTKNLAMRAVDIFSGTESELMRAESLRIGASIGLAMSDSAHANLEEVSERLSEAKKIYEINGDQIGVGEIDTYRGQLYLQLGNVESARATWQLAASRCAQHHERICEANARQNIGTLQRDSAQHSEALQSYSDALRLFDRADNARNFGNILFNVGYDLQSLGYYEDALKAHSLALDAYLEDGRCSDVYASLSAIGHTLLSIGAIDQAVQAYGLVLISNCARGDISVAQNTKPRENLGQEQAAIESIDSLCNSAKGVRPQSLNERWAILWAAWDLGNLARLGKNLEGAITCHEYAIQIAPKPNSRIGARIELADDLLSLGKTIKANDEIQKVLVEYQGNLPPDDSRDYYRARALLVAGKLASNENDAESARNYLLSARSLFEKQNDPDNQYFALAALGKVAPNEGSARDYFLKADAILASMHDASSDPAYKASVFANRRNMYSRWALTYLLTNPNAPDNAEDTALFNSLVISERSRSRVLKDLMSDYKRSLRREIRRPNFSLSINTQTILDSIRDGSMELGMTNIDDEVAAPEIDQRGIDTKALTGQEHQRLATRLFTFQRSMPESLAIVEYLLGEDESLVWVVTRQSVSVVRLPNAGIISNAVNAAVKGVSSSKGLQDNSMNLAVVYDFLIRPLEPHLGNRSIVVIADGSLHQLPFAALWDSQTKQYLVEQRSISFAPSIEYLIQRPIRKPEIDRPARALLVGDPIYSLADAHKRCADSEKLNTSFDDKENETHGGFPRLAESSTEVQVVTSVLSKYGVRNSSLVGCAANRQNFFREPIDHYSLIHIAAHATVDTIVAQQSAIHLSQFDAAGPMTSSTISVADLMTIDLSADLVVLSGCSTAGGQLFGGEGSLGLTFGVLAAGGKQVLSTLWPSADATSVDFMQAFYTELLKNELSSASALREAQLKLIGSKKWHAPRYWATYKLTG